MAVALLSYPDTDEVRFAYRPIVFQVIANQNPTSSQPSPVVFCDVYFDNVYYGTISSTDYEVAGASVIWFYIYTFDIQDMLQEYLNSNFARVFELNALGDQENPLYEKYSTKVRAEFREGYIDAQGFTQVYGTAPTKGSKYVAPVSGAGTAVSTDFYVINGTVRHRDYFLPAFHFYDYMDPFQQSLQLTHRPNTIAYANKVIGGGKYYVTREDHDYLFWFSNGFAPTWYVSVVVKYKNGTSATSPTITYPTTTTTALSYRVYWISAGIPQMRLSFPTMQWDNVVEYEVFVFAPFLQLARQTYTVQNNCERVRLFFRNAPGALDGINFEYAEEMTKTEAARIMYSTPLIETNGVKVGGGTQRLQASQSETFTVQCKDYGEKDQDWLKELLATPRAYMQASNVQSTPKALLPVFIESAEIKTLKNDGRYEYLLVIKFTLTHEAIPARI